VTDDLEHVYKLFYGDLSLCGCGIPETAYDLIRDILNLAPLYEDDRWKRVEEMIGSPGAHHIVLSALDEAGLMEHGSSIGGAWLTGKGRYYQQALAAITDWDQIKGEGFPHGGEDCTDACWVVKR
jgi:hypothetical protein